MPTQNPDPVTSSPDLGTAGFLTEGSPWSIRWHDIDDAAWQLFPLPDTATGFLVSTGLWRDQSYVDACRTALRVSAGWFGDIRPRTVSLLGQLRDYALATEVYPALHDDLAAADRDISRAAAATLILDGLGAHADAAAKVCEALTASYAAFATQLPDAVQAVLALRPLPFGQGDMDNPNDPYHLYDRHNPLVSNHPVQQMHGAWAALGSDIADVRRILEDDVTSLPSVLRQLSLDQARAEWQQVLAEVSALIASASVYRATPDLSAADRLGWFHSDQPDGGWGMAWNWALQAGSEAGLGVGPVASDGAGGSEPAALRLERLPGENYAYFKIVVLSSGKCLGPASGDRSPGVPIVQTDFTGHPTQMWRPYPVYQRRVPGHYPPPFDGAQVTLSGWSFVQQDTGLALSADIGIRAASFPPDVPAGHLLPLIQANAFQQVGDTHYEAVTGIEAVFQFS